MQNNIDIIFSLLNNILENTPCFEGCGELAPPEEKIIWYNSYKSINHSLYSNSNYEK